jgi:hypothetical protein
MTTDQGAASSARMGWKLKGWTACGVGLIAFAAGSLVTASFTHASQAKASGTRVFELMIYHAKPGQVPALEAIFRDVSKLQAKFQLDVVGYWVPNEDPHWKDAFAYLVAHPSRAAADANWKALHADPAFLPYRKAAEPLIEKLDDDFKVDEVYMTPTDFSALK